MKNYRPASEKSERNAFFLFAQHSMEFHTLYAIVMIVYMSMEYANLFSYYFLFEERTYSSFQTIAEIIVICLNIKSKCIHNEIPTFMAWNRWNEPCKLLFYNTNNSNGNSTKRKMEIRSYVMNRG